MKGINTRNMTFDPIIADAREITREKSEQNSRIGGIKYTYEIKSKIFVFSLFSEGEKLVFVPSGEVFLERSGRAVPSEQIRQLEAPDQPDRSGGSVVVGRGSNLDP